MEEQLNQTIGELRHQNPTDEKLFFDSMYDGIVCPRF